MNYEQMYKETRRWIESIYPELGHEKQMLAEKLFPELKESKDEKIMEALIDFFGKGAKNGEQTNGVHDKDILAWLKKQGKKEKDILEDAILDGYILDGNEDGLIAKTIRYKHEKHGEKKPTDSYCQENCKGFQETGKCFADGECKAKKKAHERQKVRGYLVRDEDDYTAIYAEKPHRGKTEWVDGNDSCLMTINDARLMPDIEFEDEPVEVEITLKKLNAGG